MHVRMELERYIIRIPAKTMRGIHIRMELKMSIWFQLVLWEVYSKWKTKYGIICMIYMPILSSCFYSSCTYFAQKYYMQVCIIIPTPVLESKLQPLSNTSIYIQIYRYNKYILLIDSLLTCSNYSPYVNVLVFMMLLIMQKSKGNTEKVLNDF
jgi:hypothetical protein